MGNLLQNKAKTVDLPKYIGKWNEIESFPAWFQKGCADVTAEYSIPNSGDFIEVKNSCTKNGKRKVQIGKAFKTDQNDTLKVQFFWPFKGDYKIEFVDNDYKHAVVGSNSKNYLWLLARNDDIPENEIKQMRSIAQAKGYDISKLRKD